MSSSTITNPYITENWLHMKKNHEYIKVVEPTTYLDEKKKPLERRRSALHERRQSTKESPGLIKLADSFRDTLASGRRQELAKLGLIPSDRKTSPPKRASLSVTSPPPKADPIQHAKRRTSTAATTRNTPLAEANIKRRTSTVNPQLKTVTDVISHAKRRASTTATTQPKTVVDAKRRASTLSNAPSPQPKQVADIINDAKRRSSLTKEKILQQQQPRRRTLSSGSLLLQERTKLTPTYMKSTLATDGQRRHSLATTSRTSPRRKNSIKPSDDEDAVRRKSILVAATLKARQMENDGNTSSTSSSSGGEDSKKKTKPDSIDVLSTRRMSRTENLKDGLPTSPSMAVKMTRRKSTVKQQEPKKSSSSTTTKTVRKRGKTLPGSLAKPPPVQSLQLPPMKVEPIQLNLPKPKKRNSLLHKSPSIKAVNTNRLSTSNKTTPIPTNSNSTSPQEVMPKKSVSTRKTKTQLQSRRTSLKPTAITPVSPRVQPSRRQSMAETKKTTEFDPVVRRKSMAETKQTTTNELELATSRKLSTSAYSVNSRKNSLADDTISAGQQAPPSSTKMMSLHARLQAMVAEHTINETPKVISRRNACTNESDLLLSDTKPQRIKDTLMMWDKEMVEAFSPDTPKSPQIALKYYGHHLSAYEQTEVLSYPLVYYLGQHAKKHQATPENSALNFGYDDERGDYKSVINDHLAYRYEILEELGRGSFGQVVKCFDHKLKVTVAVKLIRNKKRFYAQAKTEVKILSDLIQWDPEDRHHNVKMTDHFYFRNHLCIACECLNMNLYEFIKVNNFQGFHIPLIKRFTVQLLRSLSLLAKHGVIHCDLKPENILLKHPAKSTIKVIDFGSSCLESQRVYTYIQSRFYRSPEIILGLDYTKAIDMWSLGCILAELYTGIPLFPGENEQEQLACIMEIMGVPDIELIQLSERRHLFFDRRGEPRIVCNSRGKKRRPGSKCLSQVLRCSDPLFLDFIKQCLEWDPTKRLTPENAFQHEWILQTSTKAPKDTSSGDTTLPEKLADFLKN
ncbi:hypothetical protein G6F47_010853 [Rhizopus delemar]|nr:hypothetical protein G6F54_009634 [Rhizopus delemar]KAG1505911.1 hypothetical protein G6F53_010072 [Rhizopus delemar]KAG1587707.1 hypothetical protein G6F47_010853 [Rhizopus delemar]KAG1637076.1 hypothetical protein G6F44_009383 [Rhizopus delemar]